MDDKKLARLRQLLVTLQNNLDQIKNLIGDKTTEDDFDLSKYLLDKEELAPDESDQKGQIIEGVFDGQKMIGPDGRQYLVPPNYASKSKLIEGDILKLTIGSDGGFIYKQIQPIERDRIIGTLVKDKDIDEYRLLVDKKIYKLLTASVTYFKGMAGDKVVALIPKNSKSTWAAVENIIKSE